jgi:hypothetical protein
VYSRESAVVFLCRPGPGYCEAVGRLQVRGRNGFVERNRCGTVCAEQACLFRSYGKNWPDEWIGSDRPEEPGTSAATGQRYRVMFVATCFRRS